MGTTFTKGIGVHHLSPSLHICLSAVGTAFVFICLHLHQIRYGLRGMRCPRPSIHVLYLQAAGISTAYHPPRWTIEYTTEKSGYILPRGLCVAVAFDSGSCSCRGVATQVMASW